MEDSRLFRRHFYELQQKVYKKILADKVDSILDAFSRDASSLLLDMDNPCQATVPPGHRPSQELLIRTLTSIEADCKEYQGQLALTLAQNWTTRPTIYFPSSLATFSLSPNQIQQDSGSGNYAISVARANDSSVKEVKKQDNQQNGSQIRKVPQPPSTGQFTVKSGAQSTYTVNLPVYEDDEEAPDYATEKPLWADTESEANSSDSDNSDSGDLLKKAHKKYNFSCVSTIYNFDSTPNTQGNGQDNQSTVNSGELQLDSQMQVIDEDSEKSDAVKEGDLDHDKTHYNEPIVQIPMAQSTSLFHGRSSSRQAKVEPLLSKVAKTDSKGRVWKRFIAKASGPSSQPDAEDKVRRLRQVAMVAQPRVLPFPCPEPNCFKSYTQQSQLTAHLRRHRSKRFRCNWIDCTYVSASRSDAIKHIRFVHFRLQASKKQQAANSKDDDRDPADYLLVLD